MFCLHSDMIVKWIFGIIHHSHAVALFDVDVLENYVQQGNIKAKVLDQLPGARAAVSFSPTAMRGTG